MFSVIFFIALILDNLVKENQDTSLHRFITKSLVTGLLLVYYLVNKSDKVPKFKSNAVIIGLVLFTIGGCFGVLMNNSYTYFLLSFVFFAGGKIFYGLRLAKNHDFNYNRIFFFLLLFSLYMFLLVTQVYDNSEGQFFIIIVYFFISVVLLAFAFVRKEFVCYKSYILVFLGLLLFVISESMLAIKLYGSSSAFDGPILLVLYEVGQYLFVLGILSEVLLEPTEIDQFSNKSNII
ncbi:lysoplasmalogenase family protein [Algibacter miyuki]|uniref:Lysoplasmalogenase family protein n=1 Tax=Algibacter miyuki TaxID=1306933 RepID=A0ABV5H5D3_9FLAO|nr:lysoplasmalogenase family protein [Algibacter miyuki]MDN3665729.1 lysoplasmalogenase family protein [Algibacter miyuki]